MRRRSILPFRHLLVKRELGDQIFATVKEHLSARGMTMRQGAIVVATLITVPSSTTNKGGKRDPEMHQTMKTNQCYHRYAEGFAYGKKVHIGVDKNSGLIQSVATTAANVHDLIPAAELLHGDQLDLIEAAIAHVRAKAEHPFWVIKQQFGVQKTWLRCTSKKRCKVNVIAVLSNLFLACRLLHLAM
jgi:IS5 family transposase